MPVATPYVEHGFTISARQKANLKRAIREGKGASLRFKSTHLQGPDKLLITKPQQEQVKRRLQQGRGVVMKVSKSCLCHNQRGGNLLALAPMALDFVGTLQAPEDKMRIDDIFDRRLAYLSGQGLDVKQDEFIKGALEGMQQAKTGQTGSGIRDHFLDQMEGEGVKEFFDGFLWGLNPANWGKLIKLGVAEIDHAIKKSKKPKPDPNLTFARTVNAIATQQQGTGITFY